MKRSAALFLCSAVGLWAAQGRFTISPATDTEFALEVTKTGLLSGKKHHLVFPGYSGVLVYDEAAPESSTVEIKVQTGNVQVLDTWISDKDREKVRQYATEKELEAAKFPEITFRSNSVRKVSERRFTVEGPLTIRSTTRPVAVTVDIEPSSSSGYKFTGSARFKLSEFQLERPKAALGTIGTADEVTVMFRLVAHR